MIGSGRMGQGGGRLGAGKHEESDSRVNRWAQGGEGGQQATINGGNGESNNLLEMKRMRKGRRRRRREAEGRGAERRGEDGRVPAD